MSGTEIVIILVAIGSGSLLKSITGMGVPLVAVPTISLFIGLEEAVIVTALPNLLLNAVLAWRERSHLRSTRDLPVLGSAGVVGAVLGTLLLVTVPDEPLVVLLAVAVFWYVVLFFRTPDRAIPPEVSRRWAPVVGLGGGFLQGSIGISGPLVGTWIHSYRLDRQGFILSVTVLFALAGTAQLVVLVAGDELSGLWLATLLACGPALAAVPLGTRLRDRLSSRSFDRLIAVMLGISAVVLLVRSFG
ncbi:MAG: sulfite exporter TauE/SafE family protein [Acidimicrobiia bacterium]|nr:sulfite exporter TauE/SafE family protein [Acidimicrobiia bacterium]